MDKQSSINIALVVAIVILGFIAFKSDKPVEEIVRISNIDAESVTRIEVMRQSLDNLLFEKQDAQWFMRAPLKFKANPARINAMLHLLDVESFSRMHPDKVDLKRLDLAAPLIGLQLNEHVFKFGNTDTIDQRRYVLFNNIIHLTNDSLYQQLATDPSFFADLDLLPEDFTIDAIQYPDNRLFQENESWQLEKLMDIPPAQLKRRVFSWQRARAISVNAYTAPVIVKTITLTAENTSSLEFVIVATEPHLILGRPVPGIQYHMGSDASENLLLPPVVTE